MAKITLFKQQSVKRPSSYPPEQLVQQATSGSQRTKKIVEGGLWQSSNYMPGQQGWRLADDGAEFNGPVIVGGAFSAPTITSGAITGSTITGGTITGGTITGGTITGTTIQTATSGKRVEISSNEVRVYDGSGNLAGTFSGTAVGGLVSAIDAVFGLFSIVGMTDQGGGSGLFALGSGIDCAIGSDLGNLILSSRKADSSGGDIEIVPEVGGIITTYGEIRPNGNKAHDVGNAAIAYDDVWADDFQNVADFSHLDDRDDVAEISKIRGSGVRDPRTGLELIDDNTLPEWMLTREKEQRVFKPLYRKPNLFSIGKDGKKIIRDEDGRPYISIKTVISLLLGAVRQLDRRDNDLDARLSALEGA